MADDDRKSQIEHENKMIRRLRFLVDLTFATIAQDHEMTRSPTVRSLVAPSHSPIESRRSIPHRGTSARTTYCRASSTSR